MMASFWSAPLYSVFHMLLVGYWRDGHFYWVHRVMHPWNVQPDGGKWLYRVAHSLHHKSYNTGPFSGLSMHPIEHLFYYSCTLLPLVFTLV